MSASKRAMSRNCARRIRASSFWRIPNVRPKWSKRRIFPAPRRRSPTYVGTHRPQRLALLTECSMSDNIALQYPELEFIRPCNLCPHMKRITLKNIRRSLETPAA